MSNLRPSVLETAAPPVARAQENQAHDVVRPGLKVRCERRSASYQRTTDRPVFPAFRLPNCTSSRNLSGWHAYAPRLDRAVPRSIVSASSMRSMDIDSTHSAERVNGLSRKKLGLSPQSQPFLVQPPDDPELAGVRTLFVGTRHLQHGGQPLQAGMAQEGTERRPADPLVRRSRGDRALHPVRPWSR